MFPCFQTLSIQAFVFLHVGQVDQEVEMLTRQHLVEVRIVMRHLEPLRLSPCPFGSNIARAYKLDMRAFRKYRKIRMRNAAATDDPDFDPSFYFAIGHGVPDRPKGNR